MEYVVVIGTYNDTIEYSKNNTCKRLMSSKAYSGNPATHKSVQRIHVIHQAEFMTEITQKSRLRALRKMFGWVSIKCSLHAGCS